jgi:hypothetical protein
MWVWICRLLEDEHNAKIWNQDKEMKSCTSKYELGSEKGINLGSVLDTTVGDPEGVNGPIQVERLLRFPKG